MARPASTTDLRRSTRRFAALILPIGPLAVALLRFSLPYFEDVETSDIVRSVYANPRSQSLVLWLGFIAILTLVPAVLWVGRLTRRDAPRLTAAALLLAVPGYLSLSWLIAGDLMLWVGAEGGTEPAILGAMYEAVHPTSNIAAGIFVLGHVVGTILLGGALWRSSSIPKWAALVTIVSQPLHFVAAIVIVSPGLDLVAWGLNGVGFAAAAVAIVRCSDDEWDLPPKMRLPEPGSAVANT